MNTHIAHSAQSSASVRRLKGLRTYVPFYIMAAPVVAYYIMFHYIPMGGIIIAFKDYTLNAGILGSRWAGLEQFKSFLSNDEFWKVFRNTITISFWRIVVGFPIPIIFALLLNELRSKKLSRWIQTASYLPHFISWVVISGLLFSFFSSDGLVNQIIKSANGQAVPFMSSDKMFVRFLVLSALWKELGWNAIIYLAALSSVEIEMFEAAMIDGANRWHQLRYITFPSISGVISVMFILSLTNVLSVGFDQVLVLINSAVAGVAETIDYYIYRVGLQQINNFSYASAVGLFKSILSLVLVLLANYGARKIDLNGGLW
jgi:putative aldouronate transport system permease protein